MELHSSLDIDRVRYCPSGACAADSKQMHYKMPSFLFNSSEATKTQKNCFQRSFTFFEFDQALVVLKTRGSFAYAGNPLQAKSSLFWKK